MKRVEDMLTDEEEQALREDLRCIHRSVYPEWDRTPRAGSKEVTQEDDLWWVYGDEREH